MKKNKNPRIENEKTYLWKRSKKKYLKIINLCYGSSGTVAQMAARSPHNPKVVGLKLAESYETTLKNTKMCIFLAINDNGPWQAGQGYWNCTLNM